MKKLVYGLVAVLALSACSSLYEVSAEYEVCYPDKTILEMGVAQVTSNEEPKIEVFSFGGTNYVGVRKSTLENGMSTKKVVAIKSTTAPIRLIRAHCEPKKKNGSSYLDYGR